MFGATRRSLESALEYVALAQINADTKQDSASAQYALMAARDADEAARALRSLAAKLAP